MNVQIPTFISPSFARFVASELDPNSLSKKDITNCLKALGINDPEILTLKWKQELWFQLQIAAVYS
ncbi:hypothetical protein NIES37_51510 [Tolypothrix tenuis PCC 7101]|uniref:Uncharacterized protein n=1 Tax=Tolypothrix tenuis PCC 7101 TaxID=231146 RepID=A0A1Z4N661_9CYAN|nr:hypothetical protein [Aulosira sp. FACHB-113]BAZ01152.1 hypothetical protein NIES37_51510 [Tolypothrix tenuis PCC 7101]BAZ74926.1 hypothetical protein NIES50_35050 [Aulosira laxa NIES-50]